MCGGSGAALRMKYDDQGGIVLETQYDFKPIKH